MKDRHKRQGALERRAPIAFQQGRHDLQRSRQEVNSNPDNRHDSVEGAGGDVEEDRHGLVELAARLEHRADNIHQRREGVARRVHQRRDLRADLGGDGLSEVLKDRDDLLAEQQKDRDQSRNG